MKRRVQLALVFGFLAVTSVPVRAQLPAPASPTDELPRPMSQPTSQRTEQRGEQPVVALVESILAGEDDPALWNTLEVALGHSGDQVLAGEVEGNDSGAPRWEAALDRVGGLPIPGGAPEVIVVLLVAGLLLVAGIGGAVGAFRRRRAPRRALKVSRRRRRSRTAGTACRDAARLEARMRHRSAA